MLQVKLLSQNARLPTKGSADAAGYDLYAAAEVAIPPASKALIPTDIAVSMPEGVYGRIAARSSVAAKYHVDVGAGVIDRDYRGNLKILLFNHSKENFLIRKGDRVAQLILEKYFAAPIRQVARLEDTVRNNGGFGSSDKPRAPIRLIGLCGKKGVGKTTAADYLKSRYDYAELAFADPLKQACRELFNLTDEQLYGSQEAKEADDPFWGCSARRILQNVGQRLRSMEPPLNDLFVRSMEDKILKTHNQPVIVSDIRYENEARLIRKLGGVLIHITRDSAPQGDAHESEALKIDPSLMDHTIENNFAKHVFFQNINLVLHFESIKEPRI